MQLQEGENAAPSSASGLQQPLLADKPIPRENNNNNLVDGLEGVRLRNTGE